MANKPLVSWLLCTNVYNSWLCDAIDSCLNQTYDNFEIVVVTNGQSAFEIADQIRVNYSKHNNIKVLSTHIRNLTFSLNLGIHNCQGDLIARMDADDVSLQNRLETQVKHLLSHPEIAVLGSAYHLIDSDGKTVATVNPPCTSLKLKRRMYFKNALAHPTVMFRRMVIAEVGGYPGSKYAEDYVLWLSLLLSGKHELANIKSVTLKYRKISIGSARRNPQAYQAMIEAQFSALLTSFNPIWILSIILSMFKWFAARVF